MTGPEHYREAERLLNPAGNPTDRRILITPQPEVIALAQVHATLALAAAAATSYADRDRWYEVILP
jgi:hypothetical protein